MVKEVCRTGRQREAGQRMNKHLHDFRKEEGQFFLTQWTWKTGLRVLTLLLKYTFHFLQVHCPPSDQRMGPLLELSGLGKLSGCVGRCVFH